ncbi:hypothetical protein KCP69_02040 [Salmonella enterica subsp. enterica]|nr:hypothetical protein KCP69_02040 [Salmonella enterica subsp. enterica]
MSAPSFRAAWRQGGATIGLLLCTVFYAHSGAAYPFPSLGYLIAAVIFRSAGCSACGGALAGERTYIETVPDTHKTCVAY